MLSLLIAGRREAESLSRIHHAFRPRVHGLRRRHPSARTCRANTTIPISIASARSARPKARRSPIPPRPAAFRRACISARWCSSRGRVFGPRPRRRFRGLPRAATKPNVTNIPTGPSNVVQRLLAFTGAGGANFYNVPATMTHQRQHHHFAHRRFHRHDSALRHQHGLSLQPDRIARAARRGRLRRAAFLVGRARATWTTGATSPSMADGTHPATAVRSAGSSIRRLARAAAAKPSDVVWGDAYRITADGVTAARGMIAQNAITDASGNPLFANNTDYSVRARVEAQRGTHRRHAAHQRLQPHRRAARHGPRRHRRAGHHRAIRNSPRDLFAPQTSLPSDLTLRVYADGVPAPSGESFLVDNIEVFLTNAAQNSSLVRASRHRRAGSLRRRHRHHEHRRK